MKILVEYPVMVRMDNDGVTFMESNITTAPHTKHMDVSYKYVNEFVENRVVKIIFVKSAENDNNISTKTLCAELYEKHLKKMVGEKH